MISLMAPAYCLESFLLWCMEKNPRLWVEKILGRDLVRPSCLEFTERKYQRGGNFIEKELLITFNSSFDFSAQYWLCMCTRKLSEIREVLNWKNQKEKSRVHRWGEISVSAKQSKTTDKQRKTLITHGALWRGLRQVLSQRKNKINHRLIRLDLAKLKTRPKRTKLFVSNLTESQNKLENVHKNRKTSRTQ